ncbi:lipopolysaccharide export system permease protein [Stella humosa]|uniref:Lipopolysaccharide export system permease protein n=1 Tax=Stella humosa TaxID=94 RepID=A0A3N1M712_9PROT|nr:LPS export ABC transporter permease LptG [Stella humosa]ROP99512.1 lipopolysaccharide export system permease protein [Stella humosa]BBK31274.1 LPS export ABC transporter permease LptG [Stella humosa]
MSISPTLSRYIARQFAAWCGGVFVGMVGVAFVIDIVELLRRSGSKAEATVPILLQMAIFKLPYLAQEILPFAMLFGSMLAFWRLTRSSELLVARAAGVSAWQFLAPAVLVAFVIGILAVTVFNPVASILRNRYDGLESRVLKGRTSDLALSRTGLWLRQNDEEGPTIIHSLRVAPDDGRLLEVTVLQFRENDRLARRYDAASARLEEQSWRLFDAWSWTPGQSAVPVGEVVLPTTMTTRGLQDSFAAPETISFWELPSFITLLETAGFSAHRHRLYWHSLLAQPILLGALVLIAATFALRHTRRGGTTWLILGGVLTGFLLHFLSDVVFALGLAANIPIALAAWTPAGVCLLIGASILLHAEDG